MPRPRPARPSAARAPDTRWPGARLVARAAGVGLAALAWLACTGGSQGGADPRPNLLLVTVDTLRADRLACYGGPADAGTAMCGLADHGTRFTWALSAAPYTAPSIASILTSQYPSQHGVSQHAVSYLDLGIPTVAEALQQAGYTNAAFLSNPVLEPSRNLNQGFPTYDVRLTRPERNRPMLLEREAAATTGAALAWARVAAVEPWFLWVHYQDPHGPYDPPEAGPTREHPDSPSLPVLKNQTGLRGIPAYQALPGLHTVGAYEERYLDEVRYTDAAIARLVAGLDALGRPPAVLLTADHGEAFGEDDYWFAHGHSVGLDQVRVPLLWRPAQPGVATVVDAPVSLLDVAPSLLALAGVAAPAAFRGRPLPLPGLASPDEEGRPIFLEQSYQAGVVVGRGYYARDRYPDAEPRFDPVSGGLQARFPPRTTRLREGGASDGYAAAGEAADLESALEPLLADFLERAEHRAPRGDTPREVPPETRERLRALGYLD